MGIIRYDASAFDAAQAKLFNELSAIDALAERFSNSAAALLGSMEGPVAAIENCVDCLKLSLVMESSELAGMAAELGMSLSKMMLTDAQLAHNLETNEDALCERS